MADNFDKYPATSIASSVAGGLTQAALLGGTPLGKTIDSALRPIAQRGLLKFGEQALRRGAIAAPIGALEGAGVGTTAEERAGNAKTGAIVGGILAPVSGVVGDAIGAGSRAVDKVVKPSLKEGADETIALAQKYEVPLGIDDLTDSKFYKTLISEGKTLPFSGPDIFEQQQKQITKGAAKSMGADVDRLTPEAMDKIYSSLGGDFDSLTKGKTFKLSDTVRERIADITDFAESGAYGAEGTKILDKYIGDLKAGLKVYGGSEIHGDALAKLRSKLNSIARKPNADSNAKALASDLENVITDFIDDGSGKLADLKYRYKNFIALEPLVQKDQVDGLINPALLANRVRQVYGRQFTTGKAGELGDLARIGQLIKETVPNSGTSQRQLARSILTGSGIGLPAYGLGVGGVPGALAAATLPALGMAGNRALQSRNVNPKTIQSILRVQNQLPKPQGILGPINSALSNIRVK